MLATGLADSHIHLFENGFHGRYGRPSSGGDDMAIYESFRDVHGIERALVIGFEGNNRYCGNNAYIAELAQAQSWIAPAAYLPPWPPPVPVALDSLSGQGFVGIALYVQGAGTVDQVSRWPAETLERIGRLFRVVSFNMPASLTTGFSGVVAALAPSTVLFSHYGLPGQFSARPSREETRGRLRPLLDLASMDHVGVKVSAPYAMSRPRHSYPHESAKPVVSELAEQFGVDRLFWGSDYSPALNWVSFAQAVDVWLPDEMSAAERDAVMGGNLHRVLGYVGSEPGDGYA